jgi:arylsulfatase A-like enzyme
MIMIGQADASSATSTTAPPQPALAMGRLRPYQLFAISLWCGLVAGPLEVGTIVLRKHTLDVNQFYWMTRHFVWLIPLTNLLIFALLGLVLPVLVRGSPARGSWLSTRLLCFLTLLATFWAAFPGIYGPAGCLIALGMAARLVPFLERHAAVFRRCVTISFPVLAVIALFLPVSVWAEDRLKERHEAARPLPPTGSPNVLLIVLDTVAASHLSLHGYDRRTSPTLDSLAQRGVRFERVQATSSWTLPSHAGFFTGRWPHELSTGWLTPLDASSPILAEYLGARGYATAGFVANAFYCGTDSGLARGFTRYQDRIFPELSAFKPAALVARPVEGLRAIHQFLRERVSVAFLPELIALFDAGNRKPAAVVSRELLGWLSTRTQPERPFFAFVNFFDVHYPYQPAAGGIHRFGVRPRTDREIEVIENWRIADKSKLSARELAFARDSYDDCIADLDEQLGRLIDELERRGVLESTWLIITSDHGESFGEQPGVYVHGTSLYQSQLHVPLVIVPPSTSPRVARPVIPEIVSLRDLPATVVDLLDFEDGAPFPGKSLARLWEGPTSPGGSDRTASPTSPALSEVVPTNPLEPDPTKMLDNRRVWASLAEGDLTYIRVSHGGGAQEGLYDLREDPRQSRNLSEEPGRQSVLQRMRTALDRLTGGPLTLQRFRL